MFCRASLLWAVVASTILSARASRRPFYDTRPDLSACSALPIVYSCENTTAFTDSCCNIAGGGLVLQTQFWDTYTGYEHKGQLLPKDSWTVHGLWPDNCDGSYGQYCDLSRQYDPFPATTLADGTVVSNYTGPGVDTFVREFGREDLLDWMEKFWVSQGESNAGFWGHEFSKHATCTSTFDVKCYGSDYKKYQDVVDFFLAVRRAFSMFPTFDMLAAAGITPSNKTTYALSAIQNALVAQTGALPYLGCTHNGTVLDEVWYYNHVSGTEQYGRFKPVNTTFGSTCSSTAGIWYYERSPSSERTVAF
ncbi:ribonuclease T2 [Peniophora sp. CONT]|nr:ribonuclease T2 [Peniophora sp. CONT]